MKPDRYILMLVWLLPCSVILATNWPQSRGGQAMHGSTADALPKKVKQAWVFPTGNEVKASPVIQGDKVVVGSTDGTVYCLNPKGKPVWTFTTDNAIEAPALLLNNRVYVGNLSGHLYCLDLATGKKIWTYACDNQIMGAANWWSNGKQTLILVGSYDYFLHAVDATTGKRVWRYEAENYLNAAVAIEKQVAAFGGCDGKLHAVNILTGKAMVAVEIASYVASSVAMENQRIYVGDYDGKVTCYDLTDKKKRWVFDLPDKEIPFVGAPSLVGNRVIVGNRDRFVYCLNKNNGHLLWKKNVGNPVDASPLSDQHHVLVTTMRGEMLLLRLSDGQIRWTYDLGSPIIGNPAYSNGLLVMGALNGKVYCFTHNE
jgi:outer membrane protein assembly factor BamB